MSHFGAIFETLFSPTVLPFLIPIVGIIVFGVVCGVKAVARHQERMAMIERGMHPDSPEAQAERETNK